MVVNELINLAKANNGYVSTSIVSAAHIPRRCLAESVSAGELLQVCRGLYALPDTWEDPFYIAQYRFAKGIFSDDTALYLHNMCDRVPLSLTMTFSRNYNKSNAKDQGLTCRSCADEMLSLGVTTVKTSYGNMVRAYDLERTLCDLLRGQRVIDEQIVIPAMQAYMKSPHRNLSLLMEYADALGVERKIRSYVRVLL